MRYKVTPAIFVLLQEGDKILFLRRANTGWMDGHYDLPSGHLEKGESLRGAAKRELLEEANIDVLEKDLKLINTHHGIWGKSIYISSFLHKTGVVHQ